MRLRDERFLDLVLKHLPYINNKTRAIGGHPNDYIDRAILDERYVSTAITIYQLELNDVAGFVRNAILNKHVRYG